MFINKKLFYCILNTTPEKTVVMPGDPCGAAVRGLEGRRGGYDVIQWLCFSLWRKTREKMTMNDNKIVMSLKFTFKAAAVLKMTNG